MSLMYRWFKEAYDYDNTILIVRGNTQYKSLFKLGVLYVKLDYTWIL